MKGRLEGAMDGRWIAAAFVVTLLALAYVFEPPDSWREAALDSEGDAASLAYLKAMIAMDPGDVGLRIKLARELAESRDWEQAQAALAPVLRAEAGDRTEVWLERLRIHQMQLYDLGAEDPGRDALEEALTSELKALIASTSAPDPLAELAQMALALEAPGLAAKAYERISRLGGGPEATGWLREAGRWYLAAGEPMRAAAALHEVVARSAAPEEAEAAALEELEALRAADAAAQSLEVSARYVERFPASRPLLEAAIASARAESDAQKAYVWGRQRLDLDPEDPAWEERLRGLALDAGDLDQALRLTHRLLQRDPSSAERRAQLAEIAEWAGRPAVALPNWLWLANRDPHGPGVARGLPLALALQKDHAIIRLLELASSRRPLEPTELEALAQSCMRASALDKGTDILMRYLSRHGDQLAAWKALAALSERQGDLAKAAEAWQRVAAESSERIAATMRAADLLWRAGEREAAWRLLTALEPRPDRKEAAYWRMVADQAWELKHINQATAAYGLLWAHGSSDALVAERLILLTERRTHAGETSRIAEAAFRRLGEPRLLALGIDAAARAGRVEDLRRLLEAADGAGARFPRQASYWLRLASLEQGRGRSQSARGAYERALALDPDAEEAKTALLWLAINGGDDRLPETLLSRWEDEAPASPALWQPYAVGWSKLGAHDRALVWFRRRAEGQPRDSDAALDYADALVAVGRDTEALELRRAAYERLREKLAAPAYAP